MSDKLAPLPRGEAEPVDHPDDGPRIGDWFWVRYDSGLELGCVIAIGSNHYQLRGPRRTNADTWHDRLSFENFRQRAEPAPEAQAFIEGEVHQYQANTQRLLEEVRAVTARLGVGEQPALTANSAAESGAALVRVIDGKAASEYKAALVKAQKEELPALFKAIEESNKMTAAWMTASLIPLKAEASVLDGHIAAIEQRVFHVELYAGLCESVERIRDGAPAPPTTPVHLMQRRHYMDEECLANYQAGGMAFEDIGDFDEWLAKPENCDRLLPHPRCVVAFRVRRYDKEREVSLRNFIQVFYEQEADRQTFLYLRNGEQLWRLSTSIDFDERLFPDMDVQQDGDKVWAKMFAGRIDEIVSDGYYQELKAQHEAFRERCAQWEAMSKAERFAWAHAHGVSLGNGKDDSSNLWLAERRFVKEPLGGNSFSFHEYLPYEPDCLYYDEISKYIARQRNKHNRMVLVLQGIFDRSPVFHPHPPWSLWSPDGFANALRLVYDDARALTDGDKPDFEAYRRACNATLRRGSVTVGQVEVWERRCAEKENERRGRFNSHEVTRYRPEGDPGPGALARVAGWSRDGKATFRWRRARRNWRDSRWGEPAPLPATVTVPATELLNADAYQLGDYKRFFADPRTRADYLQWAPLLLLAEEYKAGVRKVREPDTAGGADDE